MSDVIAKKIVEEPMYPDDYVMSDEQLAVYKDKHENGTYEEKLALAKDACARCLTAEKEHVCYRLEAGQRIRALYAIGGYFKSKQEIADDLGYNISWVRALANCTPESIAEAQAANAKANREYRARQRLKAEAAAAEANRKLTEAQEAAAKAKAEAAEAKAKLALSRDGGRKKDDAKPEPVGAGNDVDPEASAADRKGAYVDPIEQERKPEPHLTGNGSEHADPIEQEEKSEPEPGNGEQQPEVKQFIVATHAVEEFRSWGDKLLAMGLVDRSAWTTFLTSCDLDHKLATNFIATNGNTVIPAVVEEEVVAACLKRGKKAKTKQSQHKQAA